MKLERLGLKGVEKVRLCSAVLLVGALTMLLLAEHRTGAGLREEIRALRREISGLESENRNLSNLVLRTRRIHVPRLPAPRLHPTTPFTESAELSPCSELFTLFPALREKAPNKLNAGRLESYLQEHARSAASLISAYSVTGDEALLAEAMLNFSGHPQVALAAALRPEVSIEEARQWLDMLKQSDSENALPNYLAALNHFQSGRPDEAVQELLAASSKPHFDDYMDRRASEEAYVAAGYSAHEAKAIGLLQQVMIASGEDFEAIQEFAPFPSVELLRQVKELAVTVRDLAQSYEQAGDSSSSHAARQMVVELGRRYNSVSSDCFQQLAGTAAELIALRGLDLAGPYDSTGQTVQNRVDQLKEQRSVIRGLYQEAAPLLEKISDQDWNSYADRALLFGEPAALQWVLGRNDGGFLP
jgi:hypothetical protein